MKGLLKLFPVAAAAFALASCSSDDLFGNWTSQDEGGLKVAVEDLMEEGMTRQANIRQENNKIDWQKGDQLNMYDESLTRYDIYKYDGTSFKGANDGGESYFTEGTEPVYALFPADRVERTSWSPTGTKAIIQIPEYITYDNHSEYRAESGNVAYVSNLPMYGTVTDGSSYEDASASLYYLTSVLRINITNAFADKVTWLKIETQDNQPISGYFETTLTREGSEKSVLQPSANQMLTTSNAMYVDLRKVPSYMTYLYLPIIAGTYDWMKVSVTDEKDVPQSDVKNLDASKWTVIRNWEAGVTFTRASVKPFSTETQYTLDEVTTVELLNKALQQYANYDREASEAGADLVLNIGTGSKGLEVMNTGTTNTNDFTIQMPEMAAEHVTINIVGGFMPVDENQTLNIVNADDDEPFTGTLTINANGVKNHDMKLNVNLKDFNGNPTANVQLVGNLKDSQKKLSDITIEKAINVVFGDGKTTTSIAPTTLTVKQAKTVTIAGGATIEAALDVMETKDIESVTIETEGEITKLIRSFEATVNVNGKAQDICVYSSKGVVNVGDGKTASGETANIYTIGDVVIANAEESEAVTGTLSVLGNNKITLKQGYVKEIAYKFADKFKEQGAYQMKDLDALNASDLQNKHITIELGEIVGEGLTAIATIGERLLNYKDQYAFVELTTSKWGGAKIDGEKFAEYVNGTALANVYTASELASLGLLPNGTSPTNSKFNLYNDVSLDGKVWECPNINYTFDGKDPRCINTIVAQYPTTTNNWKTRLNVNNDKGFHTISNLKLNNKNKRENLGLFGKMQGGTVSKGIYHLNINGIETDLSTAVGGSITNVGVLVGEIATGVSGSQQIEIKDITITGTNPFGANGLANVYNVGGMIGKVTEDGSLLITNDELTSNTVTLGTIRGTKNLGGIIGEVAANVTIQKTETPTLTGFEVSNTGAEVDVVNEDYGTIGMFVGSVTANEKTVKVPQATNDKITGHRGAKGENAYSDLGFPYNFYVYGNIKHYFYGGKAEVGYSTPTLTSTTIEIATSPITTITDFSKKFCDTYDYQITGESRKLNNDEQFNVFIRETKWDATK